MQYFERFILYAIPVFFLLLTVEKTYGYLRFGHRVRTMDIVTGLSSGITNILKDIFGLTVTIIGYQWLYDRVKLFDVPNSIGIYVVAFILLDFAGYWWHRVMHKINLFWNEHLVHHSSEEFDLACALRQPISNILSIFAIFLLPAAVFGIPPQVIAVITPLHVFAQYWYHTQYIGKLGFLEHIIVTPSHHRVHHAQNPEYLDKNLGLIFIFWDKMFGTFQKELPEIKPVYGVTRPAATWNPIKINFSHVWLLIKDAWRAPKWSDKFMIWFKPTGWRPSGFDEQYPIDTIKEVYHFRKYDTTFSIMGKIFVWIQFLSTLLFFVLFLLVIDHFTLNGAISYGILLFVSIYAYSEFMDRKAHFILLSLFRDFGALYIIWNTGFWMPILTLNPLLPFVLMTLFLVSAFFSIVLYFTDIRKTKWTKHSSVLPQPID